jgi:molecular chaperone GrpE
MSKHCKGNHKHEHHDDSDKNIKNAQTEEVTKEKEQEISENDNSKQDTKNNDLAKKCEEYYGMLQRVSADFDNFKKRTAKERETIYQDATSEAVQTFLPVLDNFERAVKAQDTPQISESDSAYKAGIELLFRQFREAFSKLGVKEITTLGQKFDPNLHNAVMHVDDDSFGDGEIIEEFQKGYIIGEKVVRHSMVKVAN